MQAQAGKEKKKGGGQEKWIDNSRRCRIFLRRRPLSCEVARLSGGGGGSSRIFPWSPTPTRFSGGGGGGSSRGLQTRRDSLGEGGGVVPWIFRLWGPFTFLGFPKGKSPESATG